MVAVRGIDLSGPLTMSAMTDGSERPPRGPISPPAVTEYRPDYLPAYLSNGLIGLRVGRVPFVGGMCIVNGLVELDPLEDGEGFAQAPYPLAGDVVVDGHRMTWELEQVRFLRQSYDFSCGELRTRLEFRTSRAAARVEVLVFCSRSLPTLVLSETAVVVLMKFARPSTELQEISPSTPASQCGAKCQL